MIQHSSCWRIPPQDSFDLAVGTFYPEALSIQLLAHSSPPKALRFSCWRLLPPRGLGDPAVGAFSAKASAIQLLAHFLHWGLRNPTVSRSSYWYIFSRPLGNPTVDAFFPQHLGDSAVDMSFSLLPWRSNCWRIFPCSSLDNLAIGAFSLNASLNPAVGAFFSFKASFDPAIGASFSFKIFLI